MPSYISVKHPSFSLTCFHSLHLPGNTSKSSCLHCMGMVYWVAIDSIFINLPILIYPFSRSWSFTSSTGDPSRHDISMQKLPAPAQAPAPAPAPAGFSVLACLFLVPSYPCFSSTWRAWGCAAVFYNPDYPSRVRSSSGLDSSNNFSRGTVPLPTYTYPDSVNPCSWQSLWLHSGNSSENLASILVIVVNNRFSKYPASIVNVEWGAERSSLP